MTHGGRPMAETSELLFPSLRVCIAAPCRYQVCYPTFMIASTACCSSFSA